MTIKRYVCEFANDMIRRQKACITPLSRKNIEWRIDRIEKHVAACHCGLITEYETMKAIIDTLEQWYIPGGSNND